MKLLNVFIECNGISKYVGDIRCKKNDADFFYADSYLNDEPRAISISLPLERRCFGAEETRNFFEGLLPEGFTRTSVAKWMHVDERDYLSILECLGAECLGAVRISDNNGNGKIVQSYEKLSDHQVKELAGEGAVKSAEMLVKAHLSLTGASGKVGLYYDEKTGEWYLPAGNAPSTHIVKQSHVRLDAIVCNEQLCLMTASKLGINVPDSFIINVGNAGEDEVLLATKRYDRYIGDEAEQIAGLARPFRLHQEDFAQALGISAIQKYEKEKCGYLQKMFRLLTAYSANPIEDQLKLWDMIIFDYLVGNTDNHIKNFSLLYSKDLSSVRLAPAYDIVSTSVYESSTRDMGIFIGGECSLDRITRESFSEAADEIGIGERLALKHLDEMCGRYEKALRETAEELKGNGFYQAKTLCGKVLERGGYACLLH